MYKNLPNSPQLPPPPLLLAPMAGFTDLAFRQICLEFGADFCYTEMVSAKGLCYGGGKTADLLTTAAGDLTRTAVQLFGGEPRFIEGAIMHKAVAPFKTVDINMGCPVPKIVKNGEGSALLLDRARAGEIVRAASAAAARLGKTVTVKMRVGFSAARDAESGFCLTDFAKTIEDCGAAAITVHGRTQEQGYSGAADYGKIRRVAEAVSIPVIANGDITDRNDIKRVLEETSAAGVMIGRAALGNPWIFCAEKQAPKDVLLVVKRQVALLLDYFDARSVVSIMKPHLMRYLSQIEGGKKFKPKIGECKGLAEMTDILETAAGSPRGLS